METRQNYNLAFAWNWQYDTGFVRLMQGESLNQKVSLLEITPDTLDTILFRLNNNSIRFDTFLDRASDSDTRFSPICDWAALHCKFVFNPTKKTFQANDKALMHHALIQAGLQTPRTLILPPFHVNPELPHIDLSMRDRHFTIKPSHGGGSEGVVMETKTLDQVQSARQQFPNDNYLLQETIHPTCLAGKHAWFRVMYCCKKVFPCWWDTETHIYSRLTSEEESTPPLKDLDSITHQIADLIKLDLFSTEVALTNEGRFIVVDYVNDPLDLRLQSEALDGVPNEIVAGFASSIIRWVNRYSTR